MACIDKLSDPDLRRWLAALDEQPSEPTNLMAWVEGALRSFFPFQQAFLSHGEVVAGQINITHWRSTGYGPEYLQQLATTFELTNRGSVVWWLMNRKPFCIDVNCPPDFASTFELEERRAFGLGNIAAHGVLNVKASAGTYFSFSGMAGPMSEWHLQALRLIARVLNDLFPAYIAVDQPLTLQLASLTPRQAAIVRQLATGADDKSIARVLGITDKTVRNQLSQIYAQVGVHTRLQLVSLIK